MVWTNKNLPRIKNRIKNLGFKYNMTNISATIGTEQLKEIDNLNKNIKHAKIFEKIVKNNKYLKHSIPLKIVSLPIGYLIYLQTIVKF